MSIDKLLDKNLQNTFRGIKYEKLKDFSIMTQDKHGNDIDVKSVADIRPNKHYWLNLHSGQDGDWMVLGYGRDGMAERFVRALNGENSLSLEDAAVLFNAYSNLT